MRQVIETLYGVHPREFATPQRRLKRTVDETVEAVDKHNGRTNVYISIYGFATAERSYTDVWINKAVFDFDREWDELVRAHRLLEERGTAHMVVFSGSDLSGHLYIFTEPTRHQQSLEFFQRDVVMDGLGITGAVDRALVGDPTSMIRVPNTWHPDAERFCVLLRPGEVTEDASAVYEAAQSQRRVTPGEAVCGDRVVDLSQFEEAGEERYEPYVEERRMADYASDAGAAGVMEAEVPPGDMLRDIDCECMKSMVADGGRPALGHHERQALISHLIELGYNPAEVNGFLLEFVDESKAVHSIKDEEQAVRIFRDGIKAPNRVSLKRMGLLRPGCPVHSNGSVEAVNEQEITK